MPKIMKSERAQIMVLMVFGLVALMGFAALAVDGSMVYSDRRYDQAAADSSAIAGAGAAVRLLETNHVYYEDFKCSGVAAVSNAISAGITAASTRGTSNYFTLTNYGTGTIPAGVNGISWYCADNDWTSGGWYADRYVDIKIQIVSETKTAFAHLFYKGPLKNTVISTVRARPRATDTFGYAIVSLSNSCGNGSNDGGVYFDGSNEVKVTSGGVFSSSCIGRNGSGDISVVPAAAGIVYTTEYDPNGQSGVVSPAPRLATTTRPAITEPVPDCSLLDDKGDQLTGGTIFPGKYGRIRTTNGDDLRLKPGLYCVSDGFVSNGGTISGTDVTIFITGGNFDMGAQVDVNLSSPQMEPAPNHAVKGMLIRMPDNGGYDQQVYLRGGGSSSFLGLVYVPHADLEVGGNSSNLSTVSCQLIGNTVRMHGDITLNVNFDTAVNVSHPSLLDRTE